MKRDKRALKTAGLLTPKTQAAAVAEITGALGSQSPADRDRPATRTGPGRPPGKRSDPAYQSVTTFLHKQTYQDVQRALVGSGQDFGDVVDELLKEWLAREGVILKGSN